MPISETKRRNNDRYNAKCDFIAIKPRKEGGREIRAAAQASGQSLQGYILQAVRERMERDSAGTAPVGPEAAPGALPGAGVVSLPSETLEAVRAAAKADGLSVSAWVLEAIKEKL